MNSEKLTAQRYLSTPSSDLALSRLPFAYHVIPGRALEIRDTLAPFDGRRPVVKTEDGVITRTDYESASVQTGEAAHQLTCDHQVAAAEAAAVEQVNSPNECHDETLIKRQRDKQIVGK